MLKIFKSTSGTLTDITSELNDYYSGTYALTFTAATDKIFIGSSLPFTHKYLKLSVVSAATSALAVKYWDGTAFRSAANIEDATAVAGKTLAASGYLAWTPDKQYRWVRGDTSNSVGTGITGLTSVSHYDMYWVQLTFSVDLTATLDWLGDLFCSENELKTEYPDLVRSNVLTAYLAGKTTWEEQRVRASELIAKELKGSQVLSNIGQVIKREELNLATVSKTAMIAFSGLGQAYADSFAAAEKEYGKRTKSPIFTLDENEDGRISQDEKASRVSRLCR